MSMDIDPNADGGASSTGEKLILPPLDEAGKEITYLFYCAKAKPGQTKSSGRRKMSLKLEVGTKGDYYGKSFWADVTFIPKGDDGHGFTVQAFKAFGLVGNGQTQVDDSPEAFQEQWVMGTVKVDSWIDKVSGEVRKATKVDRWVTDRGLLPKGLQRPSTPANERLEDEQVPF